MQRPTIVQQIVSLNRQVPSAAQTILSGSEVRGEVRPDSDTDLLVLVDSTLLLSIQEEQIVHRSLGLEVETGVEGNAYVESKEWWYDRSFQPQIMLAIVNEGVVL